MNRYLIVARENYPGATLKEICRCNAWPENIRNALADYTVTGSQGTRIYKYNHVEILDLAVKRQRKPRKTHNGSVPHDRPSL